VDEALATLVRRQAGAVSRRQLLEHVSERTLRRWLAARVLSRVLPGVYAVATSAVSTSTRLHAALLYAGANAHLSHATAAQVHGIDADAGNSLHVCVPAGRTVQPQPGISIHRSARLFGAQVHETRSRLRVTSVARTLIDLIDTTPRPALDLAVSDALRQKKVTIDYLRKQLVLSGRRRHGRELWVMLDELDPALESALEAEFAALLASAGLPAPTPQHEIWDGPLLVARVDFAYVDRKLALEVDGYEFHSRFDTFQRDRSRRRALIQRKWGVVEFTARDIRTNAGETVQSVQRLLATAA
jgi:hypothetical protein